MRFVLKHLLGLSPQAPFALAGAANLASPVGTATCAVSNATGPNRRASGRAAFPRWLAAGAASLLLSSCVSIGAGGDVPEQLIGFTARESAPAGPIASSNAGNMLLVMEPEVDSRLDVNRVPVRVDETGIAYLQNAFYVDRPARLFQHLLAETLRARTGRLVVEGPEPTLDPATRVSGRLIEMGYHAPSSTVTVTFDAVRTAADGTLQGQRFSYSMRGVLPDAQSVAPALNTAANEVAIEIADWIGR